MPKRTDLQKILIIGSGPIVIGQGAEFDYSGVQACCALRSVGYKVVLVNPNPATIMTDPQIADVTYIEPIDLVSLTRIIEQERPQALLSTMGGQTALNCALELQASGILEKYNVELIGANKAAINTAEDRLLFRTAIEKIGLESARSIIANNLDDALAAVKQLGFPIIIRPSYTLGGSGGGIAYNAVQFKEICERGLALSMNSQLLIEESLLGWKEFELEVIRDQNDNCIIVCVIENFDPMGIHTGDSITVAPAQTLTDKEYQYMRNAAFAILRAVGVETGGANVQFAVNPATGRVIVIEMNPRVSRSSALASKATGFPIAKVAALLAVGFTLDELQNDITGGLIPASFEPSLDYVVVKMPRFNFDKFPGVSGRLTTQMQSVGEVMGIADNFAAALQKALCSLEIGCNGLVEKTHDLATIEYELKHAGAERIFYVADALRLGLPIERIYELSGIDLWFIDQLSNIVAIESEVKNIDINNLDAALLSKCKQFGFADSRLANLLKCSEEHIRQLRYSQEILPTYQRIDSCAAEFPATTAYLYSTYGGECEAQVTARKKVIVLGSGPNRIGQGIEFDYCCVHAIQALQERGVEAIMINCNPETVSTDYDVSDRLYFEPITLEKVLDIVRIEQPLGVIVTLGGQTPLKLAQQLQASGVKVLGTAPEIIDLAEDRAKFAQLITGLGLLQPEHILATDLAQGIAAAEQIGFPLMLRPSYVLGGQAMKVVHNIVELTGYLQTALDASNRHPVLIDRFLTNAKEVDVDLVADGKGNVAIAGIMEHLDLAGVHSGDSSACLPAYSLSTEILATISEQAKLLALELNVVGVMNIQFAVQDGLVYILEVNPRASRTMPFVSKATGVALIKHAVWCMLGERLDVNAVEYRWNGMYAIKQPVFVFDKFPGVSKELGPQMKSTGETMVVRKDVLFVADHLIINSSAHQLLE